MTTPDGARPLIQLDGSIAPMAGPTGVRFVKKEDPDMAQHKAPKDGIYTLGKGRFKVAAGDLMPEGAEFVAADKAADEQPEPETKSGKRGPSETTDKVGEPEQG